MALPPPPQALPSAPRATRRLRGGLAVTLACGVLATLCGVAWYGFELVSQQHQAKLASEPTAKDKSDTQTDLLGEGAQTSGLIQANIRPQPSAEKKPEAPKPEAPPRPAQDQALVQAWAEYYRQADQLRQHQLARFEAGLAADTQSTSNSNVTSPTLTGLLGANRNNGPTDLFSQVASNPATDYSPYTLYDPMSRYEVKRGRIIKGKMFTRTGSDTQGDMVAFVSGHVYDEATGDYILIPQGSRMFGSYATGSSYGQTYMQVAWTSIIYPAPCNQTLDLGAWAGADATGMAGFNDITYNHYGKIFFNAILVSLFSAGIQLSQPSQSAFSSYSPAQNAAGAVGQQMGQLGAEFARKGMDIPPTQEIRQGYEFTVLVHKDLPFSRPWVAGDCSATPELIASR